MTKTAVVSWKNFHTTSVNLKSKGKLVVNKINYKNLVVSNVFSEKKRHLLVKKAHKNTTFLKKNLICCTFFGSMSLSNSCKL
jgi:hypothetical protein